MSRQVVKKVVTERRRRSPVGGPPQIKIEYCKLSEIKPYNRNPRNNAQAIEVVRRAIREFGFLVPIVVDANMEIAAGHTRYAAAVAEGMTVIPTIKADYLTPKQIQAFRISDNKVAEIATWNTEYLAMEMQEIVASGINMAELGFTEHEIDCLRDMVADDCLSAGAAMEEDRATVANSETRRAPTNTRLVIGEFVVFIPTAAYRLWAAAVRTEHEFNAEAINQELKRRLGLDEYIN